MEQERGRSVRTEARRRRHGRRSARRTEASRARSPALALHPDAGPRSLLPAAQSSHRWPVLALTSPSIASQSAAAPAKGSEGVRRQGRGGRCV
eukprot:1962995-Rhodomonas_salina.1